MKIVKPSVVELFKELKQIVDIIPSDFGGGCPLSKSFLMSYIVLKYDLKNYVEIGVYRGKSFLPMARAVQLIGGMAYGIDPYSAEIAKEFDLDEDKRNKVNTFLDTLDFSILYQNLIDLCLELKLEDCTKIIREKSSIAAHHFQGTSIDMLHIDGNHDTKYVMEDVGLYFPLVKDGGFIVIDDINWDSVKPAYRKLQETCETVFNNGSYAVLFKGVFEKNTRVSEKARLSTLHSMAENAEKDVQTPLIQAPKVSVIVLSHNQEDSIAKCLEGIFAQKGEFRLELVIGDNSSADATLDIVKSYISCFRNDRTEVKILTTANPIGVLENFKRCVDSCTGEHIIVCDGNDYWTDVHRIQKHKYYNELIYQKTKMVSEEDKSDLAIIDDNFPNPVGAFRRQEFESYLEEFESIKIYTTPDSVRGRSKDELIADFRKKSPSHAHQVEIFKQDTIIDAKLVYMIFLWNTYNHINYLEQLKTPFVFTLYPGGAFGLNHTESDRMLKRVTSSPYFRKVIVTQEVTYNYLIENNYCTPDQIEYIYGVVAPIRQIEAKYLDKAHFGFDKDTLDICFVAAKYTERGVDKGYDVFIDVARKLCEIYSNIYFHVVGGFSEQDIDIEVMRNRITFYGYRTTEWFDTFYKDKDIILSPNIPFEIHEGQFDGFPTGACVDAGLRKTAIFCTDKLHLNTSFINNKEIVIVPHDPAQIVAIIESYYHDHEKLKAIAENGYHKLRKLYSYQAQILPRINILKKEIQQVENNVEREQAVKLQKSQSVKRRGAVQALIEQVVQHNGQVRILTSRAAESERQVQVLSRQLQEVTISRAWRMALWLRRIRAYLLPRESLQARVMGKILSLLFIPFTIRRAYQKGRDLALIRSSDLFDETWYLAKNPDVAQANIDPVLHYLRFGGFEGRNPGPKFDGNWYLDTYEDVRKAGINPLLHYLKYGKAEKRTITPPNSEWETRK